MLQVPATLDHPVKFCLFNIAWTYVASVITGNCSQVDRVWTFLPMIYTAYYAAYPWLDWADPALKSRGVSHRAVLMLILQFLWMIRLSYNTWRRGLFNLHDEDYRWEIFRKKIPGWLFHIFNFVFIAGIQNILLFILGLPAHHVLIRGPRHLGISDYILAQFAVIILALEFTADNQQWSFQNFKIKGVINSNEWPGARIRWTDDDRQRGFVTRGLWAYSRHPNCACEQAFWFTMTFFPILASPTLSLSKDNFMGYFWQLLPAISLAGLFISSTIFTESISSKKYPEYVAYQSRVGMFWPPITFFKGILVALFGDKQRIERMVWGPVKGKRAE